MRFMHGMLDGKVLGLTCLKAVFQQLQVLMVSGGLEVGSKPVAEAKSESGL